MTEEKAPDYKKSGCESGVGNVSADPQSYTFTGVEAVDTTIRLRKMHSRNKYMRITALADAGFVALTAIKVGYVSRDADQADVLDHFNADIVLTTVNQPVIVAMNEIAFDHDIAITTTTAAAAGNAGKTVTLLVEMITKGG